jgi:hypothetical protein
MQLYLVPTYTYEDTYNRILLKKKFKLNILKILVHKISGFFVGDLVFGSKNIFYFCSHPELPVSEIRITILTAHTNM